MLHRDILAGKGQYSMMTVQQTCIGRIKSMLSFPADASIGDIVGLTERNIAREDRIQGKQ